jgi:mutator protein MutT
MQGPVLIPVAAGVFSRWNLEEGEPEVLLFQRSGQGPGHGAWEFPGGKLEPAETDQQCLIRELQEEIGVTVLVGDFLGASQFQASPEKIFEIRLYFVQGPIEQIQLIEHQAIKWVRPSDLNIGEIAQGDRAFFPLCFERIVRT